MLAGAKQKIQILLVVMLFVAAGRAAWIFYERRQPIEPIAKPGAADPNYHVTSDDYVFLRSLHAYDVYSARALNGKTVWVRAGNRIAYFPFDSKTGRAVTAKSLGALPPAAPLRIRNVIDQDDQVFAVFEFASRESSAGPKGSFAAPVGAYRGVQCVLYLDEIFYLDDPHQLYKQWPAEVWSAIDRREMRRGMSERQVEMAAGVGRVLESGSYGNRTVEYGVPPDLTDVTFVNNRATDITKPAPGSR